MNLKSNIREGVVYAAVWTLVIVCIFYAIACVANGFVWAALLSKNGYGLLVIRIVVSLFLALVSIVTLVFQHPMHVLYYASNLFVLIFPLAFIAGALRSIYGGIRWGTTGGSRSYEMNAISVIANLIFCGVIVYILWQLEFENTISIDVISVVKNHAWMYVAALGWVAATILGTREEI